MEWDWNVSGTAQDRIGTGMVRSRTGTVEERYKNERSTVEIGVMIPRINKVTYGAL